MAQHFKNQSGRHGAHARSEQTHTKDSTSKHFRTSGYQSRRHESEWDNQASQQRRSYARYRVTATPETNPYIAQRSSKKKDKLSLVLIALGVVLLLVAGGLFGYSQWQYYAQSQINAKLAEYAIVSDETNQPPEVDWTSLKAINDDVVGWIQIPGTNVNFPVYQGDDNETYLHTTAEGEYSVGGQIFMDCDNTAPGMINYQTLIYGHHLYDGSMFTPVDDLTDQSKFDEVDTIWYVTETATYELEPLFIYKSEATNADARKIDFSSNSDFQTYLSEALASASARSDDASDAIKVVSKVLTLCTCDYNNDFGVGNGRCLLVCGLKSEVSKATTPSN